jgi:hypothetical protein
MEYGFKQNTHAGCGPRHGKPWFQLYERSQDVILTENALLRFENFCRYVCQKSRSNRAMS